MSELSRLVELLREAGITISEREIAVNGPKRLPRLITAKTYGRWKENVGSVCPLSLKRLEELLEEAPK